MSKKYVRFICDHDILRLELERKTLLLIVAISVAGLIGMHPSYAMTGTAGSPATSDPSVTISPGAGEAPTCSQTNNCFNPSTITVPVGTTVTWNNHDKVSHTVTSGNPSDNQTGTVFDSSLIPSGKSFSFTFKQPGTYNYFCQLHPWMSGKVIVTGGSSQTPAPTINPPTPQPMTFTTPATSAADVVTISMGSAALTSCEQTGTCFKPDVLYVTPGTSVTWKNDDLISHNVSYGAPVSSSPSIFAGNMAPGQSFSYTFANPGIYPYYDKSYPWEIGFVYVK